jgi:hypothetical protein
VLQCEEIADRLVMHLQGGACGIHQHERTFHFESCAAWSKPNLDTERGEHGETVGWAHTMSRTMVD